MKRAPEVSMLGYALLGLIHVKPSSGYDLRKVFAETAMGNYSSSPGAIYPALERLESQSLIRGALEDSAGLRRRRIYRITPRGAVRLREWLERPIEKNDVMRGGQELMLRFAFIGDILGSGAAIAFLRQFRASLGVYTSELDTYLRQQAERMPLSGRLALESGIRSYRSLYDWTQYAIRTYIKFEKKLKPRPARSAEGGLV